VKGKHLIVQFDSGQVRNIEVDSSAYGNYFEPVTDSVVDSTKKKPAKKPPGRGGRGGASLGAANALVIPREPYDDGRGARNVLVLPTAFRRPE
jgi:hypothetical protein